MEYERKIRTGGSHESFMQLTIVAGQFMRLRVVRRLSNLKDLHKEGELFRAICDRETVDLFINHYDVRGQCTTVMTKALHLRKIAEHAVLFFSGRDNHFQAEAERSRLKLQKICNVHKSLARRAATRKKQVDTRIEEGRIFFGKDFEEARGKTKRNLNGIMRHYRSLIDDGKKRRALRKVSEEAVVSKWFINMLFALVFSAGGQRPQAYAKMQVPNTAQLRDMEESACQRDYFEMETRHEKTVRSLDMPHIIVPGWLLKYIKFHVQVMRPIVVEQTHVVESNAENRPLLMHTKKGRMLTTREITSTLQSILEVCMPEATNVTMMTLRAIHATMMMQMFRNKKLFTDLNEQEFLSMLGKSMNTSVKQLLTTYIGVDQGNFEGISRELVKANAEDGRLGDGEDEESSEED